MRRANRRSAPSHYNPPPRFGMRPPRCRYCGADVIENPIVHLGGGVLAKFGLCMRCLSDEMEERRACDEAFYATHHGSRDLDLDAQKLLDMGADPGLTFGDLYAECAA